MSFTKDKKIVSDLFNVTQTGIIQFDTVDGTDIVLDIRPVEFQPTGGGTGVVAPASAFKGQYTLMGNICHFAIQVDFDDITNFGTGQFFVNLPFPAKYKTIFRDGCLHDVSESHQYHVTGNVEADSARLDLFTTDITGQALRDFEFKQDSPITITTEDDFHIHGTYEADLS